MNYISDKKRVGEYEILNLKFEECDKNTRCLKCHFYIGISGKPVNVAESCVIFGSSHRENFKCVKHNKHGYVRGYFTKGK